MWLRGDYLCAIRVPVTRLRYAILSLLAVVVCLSICVYGDVWRIADVRVGMLVRGVVLMSAVMVGVLLVMPVVMPMSTVS